MSKKIFAPIAVLASATLALGACSQSAGSTAASDAASGQTSTTASAGSDYEKAKAEGVLRIGTEGTYVPFTYHDPATNELTGYDVEVITEVAKKLGLKPEFNEVKWDAIFAGLESNRYDVIANEVTPTPERKEKYGFTDTYSQTVPVAVVRVDNGDIHSPQDIKGKKSAQSVTSNFGQLAKDLGAEVISVEGFVEAVSALRDGRVDLTINDSLAVLDYFKTSKDNSIRIAFELPEGATVQALATRKDSDLIGHINEALGQLKADGTLAKLGEKYFGKDISPAAANPAATPDASASTPAK